MKNKRIAPDYTEHSGAVFPCPLCPHRVVADTPTDAWRRMYRHMRAVHNTGRDAEYTENVRRAYFQNRRRAGE